MNETPPEIPKKEEMEQAFAENGVFGLEELELTDVKILEVLRGWSVKDLLGLINEAGWDLERFGKALAEFNVENRKVIWEAYAYCLDILWKDNPNIKNPFDQQ